jgi:hypothetical protein
MSEKEFSKLNLMKCCPICGGKLESGYAIGGGIWWDTRKHEHVAWLAERLTPYPLTLPNLPSVRCNKCEIVIFDYSEHKLQTPSSFLKKCVKCGKEIPLASEECQHCGAKQ